MPEHDDELDALRAADPLARASVPSAGDPEARALFERITMTDIADIPTGVTGGSQDPGRHRRRLVLAAAAAVLAVGAVVGVTLAADDGDGDPAPAVDDTAVDDTAVDDTSGGISPGGSLSALCVEQYDLTSLANRELAFDGTVAGVDGDALTLTVNEWYRGGDGAEVTLAGASTLGGITSAGEAVPLAPGTRLLVAGDGGFAWSCGFTQPYDPAMADSWRAALTG